MTETAPVTIVSCLYGTTHDQYINDWANSIINLSPIFDEAVVATDTDQHRRMIPYSRVIVRNCTWQHPQAYYLNEAIFHADTEWVWILDIDDTALPDALDGIDAVDADVWQMGYQRSDGETYIPPAEPVNGRNVFTGTSAIRRDVFEEVGGYRDVAFQDWDLWLRLARIGAKFESSGRAHFRYRLHEHSRTETELGAQNRERHLEEMANVG